MANPPTNTQKEIVKVLRMHAKRLPDWARWSNTTRKLTLQSANKFLLGLMWDRNMNADLAWRNAELVLDLIDQDNGGSTFWKSVNGLDLKRLRNFLRYGNGGKAFHIYWNQYARQLKDAASFILDSYQGDPRKIWNRQENVKTVRKRLEAVPGIGKAIASLGVLTLARTFGLIGGHKAKPQLDVKTDVHIMRVFRRTGVAPRNAGAEEVIQAARQLSPSHPAQLDGPAWDIGRHYCRRTRPRCSECILDSLCPRIGVSRPG